LISVISAAKPKIADYPFTTLEPHLGVVKIDEHTDFVVADIPGLIEGASDGAGLGHDFLAHVERTRLLVHVLDLAPLDGSDPLDNHATIEAELAAHDPRLAALPRILVLSKADLVPPEEAEKAAAAWSERFAPPPREEWELPDPAAEVPVLITSSATGDGLDALARELFRRVPVAAPVPTDALPGEAALAEHQVFKPAVHGYTVEHADGIFRVSGPRVDRLIARHDLENEEALAHVEHTLHKMGVVRDLEAIGFEPGDDVEIAGIVFELT
jgi:GTP-binding protein